MLLASAQCDFPGNDMSTQVAMSFLGCVSLCTTTVGFKNYVRFNKNENTPNAKYVPHVIFLGKKRACVLKRVDLLKNLSNADGATTSWL